jgi:coatomer subunit beta'
VSSILSGSYEHGTTIVTTEHMSSYGNDNSGLSPRGGLVNGSLNGSVHGSEGSLTGLRPPYSSLIEERLDSISDNMSYMSLEVNTTGTGSVRVS